MRKLWSDRQNCSHNMSQNVECISPTVPEGLTLSFPATAKVSENLKVQKDCFVKLKQERPFSPGVSWGQGVFLGLGCQLSPVETERPNKITQTQPASRNLPPV